MLQVRAYTKGSSGVNEPHTDYVLEVPAAVPQPAPALDPYQGYADDDQTRRAAPTEVMQQLFHGQSQPQPQAGEQQPGQQPVSDGADAVQPYYQGSVAKARREIFYRQAGLAKELSRMGLPPMNLKVNVGKMVNPPSDDPAQQANSSTSRPSSRQLPSRNPVLQHERKVKDQMRRQQGPQRLGVRPPSDFDVDADGPLTTLMARLLMVDGVRHVRMEGVPVEVRGRRSDSAPSNETFGGNLSIERVRQLLQAQAIMKTNNKDAVAAQDQEHNARLAKLAAELVQIQEVPRHAQGSEPAQGGQPTSLPASISSTAAKEATAKATAAQHSTEAACNTTSVKAPRQHCAPSSITQKKGEGPKAVSIVLYPLARVDAARYEMGSKISPSSHQQGMLVQQQPQQCVSKVQTEVQAGPAAAGAAQTLGGMPALSTQSVPGPLPQQRQQQEQTLTQQQASQASQPTTAATMQAKVSAGAVQATPAALQQDSGGGTSAAAVENRAHAQLTAGSSRADAAPGDGPACGTTIATRAPQDLERFQDLSDDEYDGPQPCFGSMSTSDDGSWGIDSQAADRSGFPIHMQHPNITGQTSIGASQQLALANQMQMPGMQCSNGTPAASSAECPGAYTQMRQQQVSAAGQQIGRPGQQQHGQEVQYYQWPQRQPHALAYMPANDPDSDIDSTGSWGVGT